MSAVFLHLIFLWFSLLLSVQLLFRLHSWTICSPVSREGAFCISCLHHHLIFLLYLLLQHPTKSPLRTAPIFNPPRHAFSISTLHCSTQCTYSYRGHIDCTLYSELDSGGILSLWRSSPLDSVTCRSGPAKSTAPHSSDSWRNFPGRIYMLGHKAGIHHLEETLWERGRERRKWGVIDVLRWGVFMCK